MSHLPDQGATTEPAADSVRCTFFTTTYPHQMPESVFTVPLSTLPEGLSALVNSVLHDDGEEGDTVPFDFLYQDEYITTSMEKFMRRKGVTVEQLLSVEYTPALRAQEGNKLPHDDWVSCVRCPVYGNSSLALTAAYDHCVRLWQDDECLAIGSGHMEAVKEVAFHPAVQSDDAAATGAKEGKKRKKGAVAPSFAFFSGSKDGGVRAWMCHGPQRKIECLSKAAEHLDSVDTVDVNATGDLLCTGSWDKSVKVWKTQNFLQGSPGAPVTSFEDHARAVLKARFSPTNSSVLYSTGLDGCIKVWDVTKAQLVTTLPGDHSAYGMHVKPADNGTDDLIVTGHTDKRIRMFDTRVKKCVSTWAGHRQWVYATTWCWRREETGSTGTEHLIASGSEDATVRVWDLRSLNAAILTLDRLHTDGVLDVTYVGNSELATGGKDNKIKTVSLQKSS